MKFLNVLMIFILGGLGSAMADNTDPERLANILKPANEYCFVWVGDINGKFIKREEIRFQLDFSDPQKRHFDKEFVVDNEVSAEILGSVPGYRLTLFKTGNKERPLATGYYNRTGKPDNFNTTGFNVYTDTREYNFVCITESYI